MVSISKEVLNDTRMYSAMYKERGIYDIILAVNNNSIMFY